MQLRGCKLKLEIKTLDESAEKSSQLCIIQDSRDTMPRRKSIKRLSCQNLIHPGGRKRDQNEGWVLFFCRCRDKCRNQWFPFSEGKKKMKRKGCKSKKNKAGCWHSVQWFLCSPQSFNGKLYKIHCYGLMFMGQSKRPFISLKLYHGVRVDILLSSSTVFIEYIFKIKHIKAE